MLGRNMTAYLGTTGNDFILNGKHSQLNAEDIYGPLTIPVFGSDVVYDCPNAKLMEQKEFVKFGLSREALESYVPLAEHEVLEYIKTTPELKGKRGELEVTRAMAEITIFTASRTLQGEDIRNKLSREMAQLYHDLDKGFQPINFVLPWAPLPHNRRRDAAHAKMRTIYTDIIAQRRKRSPTALEKGTGMLWHLMRCSYKNGTPVPDNEIAHMMITLLMGGQHSSSSASSWIILCLAAHPEIQEELYQEQVVNLGIDVHGHLPPLRYKHLDRLPLLQGVIKETLRVHPSITSILRKVTQPLVVPGTSYVIGTDKVMLASPAVTARSEEHFPHASTWDPYRWLEREDDDDKDPDVVDYGYGPTKSGSKGPFLPFGAGRHRCIGEKFAYVNLGAIVATLMREFRFEGEEPETDYTSLFSGPKSPAVVRWERRGCN